jgi:hypothetical protein
MSKVDDYKERDGGIRSHGACEMSGVDSDRLRGRWRCHWEAHSWRYDNTSGTGGTRHRHHTWGMGEIVAYTLKMKHIENNMRYV